MGEAVMVYHSSYNGDQSRMLCNMCILPIKTQYKGPAPLLKEDKDDVIDEALNFFKANVLFRNYEVKGGADRVLLYLTYYIKQCLQKIDCLSKGDATKALYQFAIENFQIPGDSGFVFGGYFTQLRQEVGVRLVERVYKNGDAAPSKWWVCF